MFISKFRGDSVYLQARQEAQCVLMLIGATLQGRKELAGFTDGALGFWASLSEVFGQTHTQRCWIHKRANVLNKMPTFECPEAGKTPKR